MTAQFEASPDGRQRLNGVLIEHEDGFGYQALTEFAEKVLRELNLKSFAQVELSYCHHRDGLRPGSTRRARALSRQVAEANDEAQFAELSRELGTNRVGGRGFGGDPKANTPR